MFSSNNKHDENFASNSNDNGVARNHGSATGNFTKDKVYENSNYVANPSAEKASSITNCLKTGNPNNCSRITSTFDTRPYDKDRSSYEQMEKDRVKNNIDFNLFNTLTFDDVIVYDNEPEGRLGLDRCLDNKVGTCVPYGNMTGIAYYYPPQYTDLNFGDVISSELTPEEQKQPYLGTLSYPNLR